MIEGRYLLIAIYKIKSNFDKHGQMVGVVAVLPFAKFNEK